MAVQLVAQSFDGIAHGREPAERESIVVIWIVELRALAGERGQNVFEELASVGRVGLGADRLLGREDARSHATRGGRGALIGTVAIDEERGAELGCGSKRATQMRVFAQTDPDDDERDTDENHNEVEGNDRPLAVVRVDGRGQIDRIRDGEDGPREDEQQAERASEHVLIIRDAPLTHRRRATTMAPMPRAAANGIEIEYESLGDEHAPPLVLIMGLGMQLIAWPDELCAMLVERGFRVIRFDNRDVGLSSKIEGGPRPNLFAAIGGDASSRSYTLEDMADDTVGLLDVLGLSAAHVVGASMGGMIAQVMALRHPARLLSLCSIMSTTGDRRVGLPRPDVLPILLGPAPRSRAEAEARGREIVRMIGSTGFDIDFDVVAAQAGRAFERCFYPAGFARQFLAVLAGVDRTERLRGLRVPTLVIHGTADPLIQPSGGEATAAAIPDAEWMGIEGMGHDLPRGVWPTLADAIARNARRARASAE